MPAAMSANAAAWYQRGASPSSAAESRPANTGVRLAKKVALDPAKLPSAQNGQLLKYSL